MVKNGPIWSNNFQYGAVWSKIVLYSPKLSLKVQNCTKWFKMVQNGQQMVQKDSKWSKMVQNGQQMVQTDSKWSKMVKNGQNLSKWSNRV